MSDYQNRTESRSLQRVELRKIRSEYKKLMKGFSEGNKYNSKKFRKTAFYYQLKQSATGTVIYNALPPSSLTINSPVSKETLPYQSESSDIDSNTTDSSLFGSGEQSSFAQDPNQESTATIGLPSQDNAAIIGLSNQDNMATIDLPNQEGLSITSAKNHMSGNTDSSVTRINQNTASKDQIDSAVNTPDTCAYQEESPSLQPNALGQASKNICKEEGPSLQSGIPVVIAGQSVTEDVPITVVPEGSPLQPNTLLVLYVSDQVADGICTKCASLQANAIAVSNYYIVKVAANFPVAGVSKKDVSAQTDTPVALDGVEKATEDITITESFEEDVAFQSDANTPLGTDKGVSAALWSEGSPEVGSFNSTPGKDKQCVVDTSIQISDTAEQTDTEEESGVADTLDPEAHTIAAEKREGDPVNTSGSETDIIAVMADKEKKANTVAKDLTITPDFNSFKLELNTLPPLSVHMFDELQAYTDTLVNAGDPENMETGEDKEESLDDSKEVEDEEEERSAISSKKINSGFSERPVKETTPSSSIASVLCEESTSLATPPQSITSVIFSKTLPVPPSITGKVKEAATVPAIQEVTFSLSTRDKKKRFQNLRNKTGAVVPKIKKAWNRLFK